MQLCFTVKETLYGQAAPRKKKPMHFYSRLTFIDHNPAKNRAIPGIDRKFTYSLMILITILVCIQ